MDPFEVRVKFTGYLKRLGASRDSILKVASYALEHVIQCDDLFNCILEQLNQASLRDCLNLLYLIDALCNLSINSTPSLRRKVSLENEIKGENEIAELKSIKKLKLNSTEAKEEKRGGLRDAEGSKKFERENLLVSSPDCTAQSNPYIILIEANLKNIFEIVVPKGPNGTVNLSGARKVLSSWGSKNFFPNETIRQMEEVLKGRQVENVHEPAFSRNEVFRRIEEDRERHKRMKEENWIQPTDPAERNEFDELYDNLEQPDIDDLFDTLEKSHLRYLYDTTSLGNPSSSNYQKHLSRKRI